MIVTIDGPAGVGKSTAARQLAEKLGFDFLDTGAMYRVVALTCLERNWDAGDSALSEQAATGVRIEALSGQVLRDGQDVSGLIRTPGVSHAASLVAQNPRVREALVKQQREVARSRHIVSEGRDQGTVVFPQAECKFFLTADTHERAARRFRELTGAGHSIDMQDLLRQQQERDDRDQMRSVSPLCPAQDAVIVDTTNRSPAEVIDFLVDIVNSRR